MTQSRAAAYRSQMKTGLHRFHGPKLQEAKPAATMPPVAVGLVLELCGSSALVGWVRRPVAFTKLF